MSDFLLLSTHTTLLFFQVHNASCITGVHPTGIMYAASSEFYCVSFGIHPFVQICIQNAPKSLVYRPNVRAYGVLQTIQSTAKMGSREKRDRRSGKAEVSFPGFRGWWCPPPVWRPRLPAKTSFLTCYKRRLSRHSICNVIRRTHQYVDEKNVFFKWFASCMPCSKIQIWDNTARTWASYSYSQYGYNSCV